MSADGAGFVNLHNHSHYSILDGYATPEEHLRRAAAIGQTAFALTDHGNLYGIHELIKTARNLSKSRNKKGKQQTPIYVKPIAGLEAYVAPLNQDGARAKQPVFYGDEDQRDLDVSAGGAYLHLTLLAMNEEGFHNLIKLSTESFKRENFYKKQRIDQDMLSLYSDGLIAFTGCPSGEIQTRLRLGQVDEAYDYARRMKELFPGRYFVELMQHHMKRPLERDVIPQLVQMAKDLDLPLVATNDAHYAAPEDAKHQDEMLCITTNQQGGKSRKEAIKEGIVGQNGDYDSNIYMDDASSDEGGPRFSFDGDDYYLKTEDEIREVFPDDKYPGAVDNTVRIADMVADWWSEDESAGSLPHSHGGVTSSTVSSGNGYAHSGATDLNHVSNGFKSITTELQTLIDSGKIGLGPYDLSLTKGLRPKIDIPEGWTERSWFQKKINDGFENRRVRAGDTPAVLEEAKKRIATEFPVFADNDFIQYMLVVQDYINAAREKGIGVGYGRGSVGGSEIAYDLDISRTDPIRHDLLFERFLNPERVSPPDVDTDFQASRRNEVFEYARDKYGWDHVANIVTFGTFGCKQAFRDVAKIYRMPPSTVNKISKLIPEGSQEMGFPDMRSMYDPSSKWWEPASDFRAAVEEGGEQWAKIGESAAALEGRVRSTGTHACGVIMCDEPISNYVPLCWESNEQKAIDNPWTNCKVQWGYEACESLGLIKMDFLSLSDLDVVKSTLANIGDMNEHLESLESSKQSKDLIRSVTSLIKKRGKTIPDMDQLVHGPMDDRETYEMIGRGDTVGCFQLGSDGMRDLLRLMKPTEFNDIAAANALYRPGPMKAGAHTAYANRKNKREPVYVIDQHLDRAFRGTPVESVLAPTYGCMVYQEQVMTISRLLSGYSRGEADSLRKAIGHKIPAEMERNHDKFVDGALRMNADVRYPYTREDLEELWSDIQAFASYGFNKSHAVSYGIVAYETAYLKCHYPSEFYSALMTSKIGNKDQFYALYQSLKRNGLKIGPISVNESGPGISPSVKIRDDDPDVIFGFSMIKGIGDNVGNEIVKTRRKNGGSFKSLDEFLRSASNDVLKIKVVQSLADVGAFECLGVGRQKVSIAAKDIVKFEKDRRMTKSKMAGSLFESVLDSGESQSVSSVLPDVRELPWLDRLSRESDDLGMTASGDPMDHIGNGLDFLAGNTPDSDNYVHVDSLDSITASTIDEDENGGGDSHQKFHRRKWMDVLIIGYLSNIKVKKLKSGAGSWYSCEVNDLTGSIAGRINGNNVESIKQSTGGYPREDYVYMIRGRFNPEGSVSIDSLEEVPLDDEGRVPFVVRVNEGFEKSSTVRKLKKSFKDHPGTVPAWFNVRKPSEMAEYKWNVDTMIPAGEISLDQDAIIAYEGIVGRNRMCSWKQFESMSNDDSTLN
jgi:DNA polymerase-3 subunit alpha